MKSFKLIILFFVIALFFGNVCFAATDDTTANVIGLIENIELTQAEKDFIEQHPVIRLGIDPQFVPYEFIDSDGVYKGIAADYIELICQKTGLNMVVTQDLTWSEAYEKAVEKELDVLPCISKTEERQKYLLFSEPYFSFQRVVFVNEKNKTIKSFDDLYGQTVAVQINSSHHSYLSSFDSINLNLYLSAKEALQAVSDGTETAFVGNLATSSYLIKAHGITNLKYLAIDTDEPQSLYFAVRNDWPELVGIINKALDSINEEEKISITNKWIGITQSADYSEVFRIAGIIGIVIAIILTVSVFWIIKLKKEIAKRKKTQEELNEAKEEAERATQVKSMFLAKMSHEVRTPLNAITGMAYLIKKTGVTATQSIYLGKLTQAARNMLGIINDILDFSKIEAGKMELERTQFDLDKVLQHVINIASAMVEERGIEFALDKDLNVPTFYFGDPAKIEQILINLISNAVKFTEAGSVSFSIRTKSVQDNIYKIEFCVKDTGIGMEPEQVKKLFVPFDQADSSINRRFGGTGLGLSIVKNLTDLMNGEIEVQSVLNEGSTFCIRLPLEADINTEEIETKRMSADCFKDIRALVLDKNENVRTLLKDCFRSFGITADFVSSEEEAIMLLRKSAENNDKPFNLIIADFLTPNKEGIEFLVSIKKKSLFKQPPKTILMIPISREELYDELETAGIDFGITKPIISSILYNGIIEIFNIAPPEMTDISMQQDMQVAPNPYHILLVEDNRTNQFISQSILEQAGLRVSKASNGEEGYQFFEENRENLDLILMDIHMPVMDGYTSADMIRSIDKDIPIIAMTADAISGVEETCRSHGMNHYVSKPFEPDQFISTVLDVLKLQKIKDPQKAEEKDVGDEDEHLLDLEDGIKRIGGDSELFYMILDEYYNENSSVAIMLKEKIDSKDYAEAVKIVHKIKSSSGNIGAKSLFESASELQKALQAGEEAEILKWHGLFQTIIYNLMIEIENILAKRSAP